MVISFDVQAFIYLCRLGIRDVLGKHELTSVSRDLNYGW